MGLSVWVIIRNLYYNPQLSIIHHRPFGAIFVWKRRTDNELAANESTQLHRENGIARSPLQIELLPERCMATGR
jgi:hypothetical protein